MSMMSEPDRLRGEIRDAVSAHRKGDLPQKTFQKKLAELSVALCRAVIKSRLSANETILAEHHVARSHLKLDQSILRDGSQKAVSLFLTDRRLWRLQSVFQPDQAVTCDQQDSTAIDQVGLGDIRNVRIRREIRTGELIAGAVIMGFALLFHRYLAVTGPLMIVLGFLGMLHGLFLPTKWVEIEVPGRTPEDMIRVYAVRKKSARKFIELLKENIHP